MTKSTQDYGLLTVRSNAALIIKDTYLKFACVLLIAILVIMNFSIVWLARSKTVELTEFNTATKQLERSIGFGGLIHHFKNAILRPDEPEYIGFAQEAATTATALSAELSRRGENIGLEGSERLLAPIRGMIRQYEARLLLIERGPDRGLSPRDIDQRVRYDHDNAVKALDGLSAAIDKRFSSTQTIVNVVSLGMNAGIIALFISVILAAALRRETWLRERTKLLDSNEALNRFAMTAAHELRTPASQVAVAVELLRENQSCTDPNSKKLLDMLERISASMTSSINAVLDFSRQVHKPIEKVTFVMRDLVEGVAASVRDKYVAQHDIRIGDIPDTPSDQKLMEHVWTNLVENAVRYAKPGELAEITISGQRLANKNVYVIEDKGIGIPASQAQTIFEPMQRLAHSAQFTQGHGVGLALVKSIIDRHGGTVQLDTSYVQGARFVFTLPRTG